MKFHITITDNETGATGLSTDTDVLVCAYNEERGTGRYIAANGDKVSLMATATGAIVAANEAIEDLPKGLRKMVEKLAKERTKKPKKPVFDR